MSDAPSYTLRDLHIDFVSLVPKGADPDAHIKLAKAAPEPITVTTNPAAPTRAVPAAKEPTVAKLNDTVAKALGEDHGFELSDEQIEALNAGFKEPVEPTPDPEPAPDADPTPEPDATAATEAAIAEALVPLQKQLDEAHEASGIAEAVAKARVDYADLAVDHEALGGALYRMTNGGATAEDVDLMSSTLKAANEQGEVAKLTRPIGFDGDAPEGSAAGIVDKIAKTLQDADPAVTELKARVTAATSKAGIAAYDAAARE